MKNLHIIYPALALAAMLACGGSHNVDPVPPPPAPPTPVTPAPVAAATYQAKPKPQGMALMASGTVTVTTPTGEAPALFIVSKDGSMRGELAGWNHLRAILRQTTEGALSVSTDATLTDAQGASVPLALSGQLADGRMIGTANGLPFDLEVTTLQDQPVDLATKVGTYLSTTSNNGQWIRVTLHASGMVTGVAYPSREDALADTNRLGYYTEGNIGYSDGDPGHTRNVFNFGLRWRGLDGNFGATTYGLATFTADGGFVALTANHINGGQVSAAFVRE